MKINFYLFLEKLKKSGPCRVVNVASIMGKLSNVSLETVNTCNESMVYSWTKQCNILFTRELAKRLKDTKVHVYALHPGAIYTDIWRHLPKWFLLVWIPMMKFIYKVIAMLFKTFYSYNFHLDGGRRCPNQYLLLSGKRMRK